MVALIGACALSKRDKGETYGSGKSLVALGRPGTDDFGVGQRALSYYYGSQTGGRQGVCGGDSHRACVCIVSIMG